MPQAQSPSKASMSSGHEECALLDSGPQDRNPHPGAHLSLAFCQCLGLGHLLAPGWGSTEGGLVQNSPNPGHCPLPPGWPCIGGCEGAPQPAVLFKLLTSSPGSLLTGLLGKSGLITPALTSVSPITGSKTVLPAPEDSRKRKTWNRVGWGPRVLTRLGSGPHHHRWATSPTRQRHSCANVINRSLTQTGPRHQPGYVSSHPS